MSESTAEVTHTLLAEAAKAAEAAGADSIGVGDLKRYLEAYYRHVPPEDLLPAGPLRAGLVAAEHARVAARRPQGRALVRVHAAGESAALEESRGVVDVVTDDMPFLVDSITNELARHNLDSYHIVHPQLMVRRDVSGELREVVGPPTEGSRGHDEITESWMHIEIGTAGADPAGLQDDLRRVLADVRVAVEDHSKMQGQALRVATQLGTEGARAPAETQALLRWLADNHFTFLGYREYDLVEGPDGMALQAVPGTGLGILRHDKPGSSSFAALPPEVRARAKDPQRLILTKANSRSTVHRRSYLDYIAIKRISASGEVNGECSHDGQDLTEILEGYPREELFQISVEELTPIALAVLRLRTHRQTRLFLRKDIYGRFMSCMVYLPRDRYTTAVRLRIQQILREALHGVAVEYNATVGESALARLHVVVRAEPGTSLPDVDTAALEAAVAAAARSWDEDLAAEATRALGEEPARALLDICSGNRTGSPITLTDVLPRLQNMGVEVVDEHPYEFTGPSLAKPFWIYDFGLARSREAPGPSHPEQVKSLFEDALMALWRGKVEDDGFNALVLHAHLTWQQVSVLRAYAKYLRQAGTTFSQRYIERVLDQNMAITRLLIRLFESRFDPTRQPGEAERSEAIAEEILGQLDEVAILDHDRILRSYLGLIQATLRTSYFQADRVPGQQASPDEPPYLVVKLDARRVPELPAPRPRFELFVYSPRLEAVHLRFASVARGGLRWSDRREDFRTEILGLAKAQEVKNSVIVPSGAKGGFVCKNLPDPADREAYQGEVRACYQTFIRAMLDVTDNLRGGQVVPPPGVVRHDGDDPYLVVAADKGTATFSDTANEISNTYGYWLGDAFASGGSEGYDHKKMGITARGAWESVRFHFATLGTDVDADDFTVAGIGDMSGDVFGNGMLLSEHIKLVAAFDHRHIFIDPDPDPATSFAERERLFALPRSSWADYNTKLISPGGGVWPRTAKSVPVSAQARAALGLDDSVLTLPPDQLISAILAAPVGLLWNGGIGTYVKASAETHADAGDRANDAVRIDAPRLRAQVVAEGGNLGLTQAARIEYALAGGLVNTDFIDNSAGVDTSDHEVNIKILLQERVTAGELTPQARSELLQEMTSEVAALVLRQNFHQNRALAAARAQAAQMLHVHARYLRKLERDRRIDRDIDSLPGDKEIAERRSAGLGLTVPEFAVLLAQTKISAVDDILDSDLPDDPFLREVLSAYFPAPLRVAYATEMGDHPLRREIITTAVVNDMVNRSGTTFLFRMNEETGASVPDMSGAWLVAREVFDMAGFWAQVEALDGQVDVATQLALLLEGRKLVERAARWLLHNRRPPFDIRATIEFFSAGMDAIGAGLPKLLAGRDLAGFTERQEAFIARDVPVTLAERVAAMVPAYSAFDVVEIAAATGREIEETAEVYFDLADRLQIARLRDQIVALPRDDRWNTMARGALRDDLYAAHAALARDVLMVTGPGAPEQRLAEWVARNGPAVQRATQTLTEIWQTDRFTVATLSVAVRAIRTLVAAGTLPPHQ